jgi:glycine C-acetyltransferase
VWFDDKEERMYGALKELLSGEIKSIKEAGLFKGERIILSPQAAKITVKDGDVINFCANNYLGLSSHPRIIEAAHKGLDQWGFGLSSVRFICGTQDIHKQLEKKIAHFLGMDDAILYTSCFDANGGLFEAILSDKDAIISDQLNHASIIDGVRLCKADRKRYRNSDMNDLEDKLKECKNNRLRLIATDGVFSMDGYIAKLNEICDLAEKYNALVMVDDSHATGFVGKTGRGTPEYRGVMDRIDIITSTLGKALGGASGGFTAARKEIAELLRQISRPYLFSNTLTPSLAAAGIEVFRMLSSTTALRDKLMDNTRYFREKLSKVGYDLLDGETAIVPVMLYDAKVASALADAMLEEGIYVIGFSFPVVPRGEARIRVQISAAHEREHLDRAVAAFATAGKKLGII